MRLGTVAAGIAAVALAAGMMTGCAGRQGEARANAGATVASGSTRPPATEAAPSSPATPSAGLADDPTVPVRDDSIRAVGKAASGTLVVKPAGSATVAALGAPSCFGGENDLRWTGDYEVVWEPASGDGQNGEAVMKYPAEMSIIRPDREPVELNRYEMDGTELFAFVPKYADCHGVETYFFGVKDGEAFLVPLAMNEDETADSIAQDPDRLAHLLDGELVVRGGYAAGMDAIPVYRFRYDSDRRVLALASTEHVHFNE